MYLKIKIYAHIVTKIASCTIQIFKKDIKVLNTSSSTILSILSLT